MTEERTLDVLVVDDEAMILSVLSAIIEELGHSVRVAEDGYAALTAMQELASDLIITDLSMPGMNGFELTRQIQALYPQTSMVLMTGHSSEDSYRTAMSLEMTAYLAKPFKASELSAILDSVVERTA
jgi:CheY-like chemotaxis protein